MKLFLALRHLYRRWWGHRRCLKRIAVLERKLAHLEFGPSFGIGPGAIWQVDSVDSVSAAPVHPHVSCIDTRYGARTPPVAPLGFDRYCVGCQKGKKFPHGPVSLKIAAERTLFFGS